MSVDRTEINGASIVYEGADVIDFDFVYGPVPRKCAASIQMSVERARHFARRILYATDTSRIPLTNDEPDWLAALPPGVRE